MGTIVGGGLLGRVGTIIGGATNEEGGSMPARYGGVGAQASGVV